MMNWLTAKIKKRLEIMKGIRDAYMSLNGSTISQNENGEISMSMDTCMGNIMPIDISFE